MDLKFIVLPLTGALIGFLTNWVAIKFLFWPKKKKLGLQGVVPKRKKDISGKVAEASLRILPEKIERLTSVPIVGEKILTYIKKEVAKKINEMDDSELQNIIEKTARKEFRFIEYSGGVLGFVIGLMQAFVVGYL